MKEQPETSKEQGQGQIPPTQISELEISILQNPLNIEKGKRERLKQLHLLLALLNSKMLKGKN